MNVRGKLKNVINIIYELTDFNSIPNDRYNLRFL